MGGLRNTMTCRAVVSRSAGRNAMVCRVNRAVAKATICGEGKELNSRLKREYRSSRIASGHSYIGI